MDSVGVMPHPTGHVERTSTIDRPPPASWISNARRSIAFVRPIHCGSAIEPRAAYDTPGSSASISVIGIG